MGAMEEEIKPILNRLKFFSTELVAGNRYYKAKLGANTLIVSHSRVGKVHASMTATIMIEKFRCKMVLFSGVAGGINPDLKVGDLVIGDKLCQHDMDITAFNHDHGYISGFGTYAASDKYLVSLAKDLASKNNIPAIVGTIATGDAFINCNTKKEWIRKTFNADALEMEGGAVAQVCQTYDIPYLIIRSISDTADGDAKGSFEEFLEHSADRSAKLLFELISHQ